MHFFQTVRTRNELASYLGIPRSKLTHILYVKKVESYYSSFEIPKRSGGVRVIDAPSNELKSLQKNIANRLSEYRCQIFEKRGIKPNISHAFENGKSILTNAKIHRNKRFVLNLDLMDFFGTIHFGRVCGYFEKNKDFKMPHEVAVVMAQLCCYQGKLPQGAPTSPIISNLICEAMDVRILQIAKKYHLDYTRYADDLTFSTNDKKFIDNYESFLHEIEKGLNHAGFQINAKKTRLQFRDSRQSVTGLIVNKRISVAKEFYKDTRSMAHSLYKTGEFQINGESGTLAQLDGRFAFIHQLDQYNSPEKSEQRNAFFNLNGRELEYQKFLFYKYFYANDKPLVVTEGKTDIIYIKAALMALHEKYPELVCKNKDGTFTFNISFLRKSKRLRYFMGIYSDGADALTNIYSFYVGDKGRRKAYYKYFSDLRAPNKQHPVILLFDNELGDKNRPMAKAISAMKIGPDLRSKIIESRYGNVVGNLFLVTHPLEDGAKIGEIESLFTADTRAHIIEGKRLSLKDQYDTSLYYGKDIFSKYVLSNYAAIDFSRFIPLLDSIKLLIENGDDSADG